VNIYENAHVKIDVMLCVHRHGYNVKGHAVHVIFSTRFPHFISSKNILKERENANCFEIKIIA
jgi:hypothetical protein